MMTSAKITARRLGASLFILTLTACVPTDPASPRDDDGFTSFMPDDGSDNEEMSADGEMGEMGALADMGDTEMGDAPDVDMDTEPGDDMSQPEDMAPRLCSPNRDGVITRQEVPLRAGLSATYKVATDTPVDTAGEENADGTRAWNLNVDLANDHRTLVEARDPKNQWYSPDFPEASYVTPLSDTSSLLGVFRIGEDSLDLLGVVSPEDGFGSTILTYDPPVQVLAFPLEVGASWSTESTVTGLAQGVMVYYTESYNSQVDASGTLDTPFGEFDVLRVRVELERTINFFTTRVRTYAFASECFGTVATIVSEDDESEVEFTTASEVRRLAQ